MRMRWIRLTALCFLVLTLPVTSLVGCNGGHSTADAKTTETKTAETPIRDTFTDAEWPSFYPTVDGGGYVTSANGGVWYVRGSEAVRVKEAKTLSASVPPSKMTSGEKALWTQLQVEIAKREQVESELDSLKSELGSLEAKGGAK